MWKDDFKKSLNKGEQRKDQTEMAGLTAAATLPYPSTIKEAIVALKNKAKGIVAILAKMFKHVEKNNAITLSHRYLEK